MSDPLAVGPWILLTGWNGERYLHVGDPGEDIVDNLLAGVEQAVKKRWSGAAAPVRSAELEPGDFAALSKKVGYHAKWVERDGRPALRMFAPSGPFDVMAA